MNNDINIEAELKENKDEGLIKEYKIYYNEDNMIIGFTIITLEDNTVNIDITEAYCYLDQSTKEVYENFQSLLSSVSPLYSIKFNEILIEKLSKFSETSNEKE